MSREVVATVVPIGVLRPNAQEVTDGGVMADLFTVNLGAVGVVALEGLADDGV